MGQPQGQGYGAPSQPQGQGYGAPTQPSGQSYGNPSAPSFGQGQPSQGPSAANAYKARVSSDNAINDRSILRSDRVSIMYNQNVLRSKILVYYIHFITLVVYNL